MCLYRGSIGKRLAVVKVENRVNKELSPVSYVKIIKLDQILPNMIWNSNTSQRKY